MGLAPALSVQAFSEHKKRLASHELNRVFLVLRLTEGCCQNYCTCYIIDIIVTSDISLASKPLMGCLWLGVGKLERYLTVQSFH